MISATNWIPAKINPKDAQQVTTILKLFSWVGKVGEAPPSVSPMCKKEVSLNFLKYIGNKRGSQ